MRVVILTQYYPPEPIPRPHELARGLADRGHEVIVITGFPNYPTGRLYPGNHLRLWRWVREDNIGRILEDDVLRAELARQSRARAECFSWEKASLQLRRVFEEVYNSGRERTPLDSLER